METTFLNLICIILVAFGASSIFILTYKVAANELDVKKRINALKYDALKLRGAKKLTRDEFLRMIAEAEIMREENPRKIFEILTNSQQTQRNLQGEPIIPGGAYVYDKDGNFERIEPFKRNNIESFNHHRPTVKIVNGEIVDVTEKKVSGELLSTLNSIRDIEDLASRFRAKEGTEGIVLVHTRLESLRRTLEMQIKFSQPNTPKK